ncbi:hypothetical protein DIPPA_13167 [Diplonema papillatum]|nr:hypothetical protein DIPPA_13167 [Diplonema papillatum]
MANLLFSFYTQRWLLVESRGLGMLYWCSFGAMVMWTFVQLLMVNGFVDRYTPVVNVNFWQDLAVDGNAWYRDPSAPPYCDRRYYWEDSKAWGSDRIACLDPADAPRTTYFYQESDSVSLATSIAYGTEYESNEVYVYKHVEKSILVLQPAYWTERETGEVSGCAAFGADGRRLESRVRQLYPMRNASSVKWQERSEYLMLSLEDVLRSAGVSLDDVGGEGAPLRLQGIELVAHVDVRNFNKPFRVFDDSLSCEVRFRVLRNQFTLVRRFYDGTSVAAVQHGVKITTVATGSIGYPSVGALFETGLAALRSRKPSPTSSPSSSTRARTCG